MAKKFYITSAIPYVNSRPHVGHALEFVQTDVIARYNRLLGKDVVKLCGGDENALKNVQAAEKEGTPIKEFVDRNNLLFVKLTEKLNAKYDIWQKGSDTTHHFPSSQALWKLCEKDIYKKKYKGLYCVGCEAFYTPDELNEKGECFEHPGKKLEEVEEENYFFKLSKYGSRIKKIIETNEVLIIPEKRRNEVLSFLSQDIRDISISRSNERAKNWGVPVPGDATQKVYVWFDALNTYQSGVGFGWDEKMYKEHWPADIHVIGKGILRFHAVYWLAFLLSAGLKLPKTIFVHEYFTVNGQKMSKTLGNVVDPVELVDRYGADALRYYFLAKFSPFSDGDFSEEKFREVYNSDLANGLGNLVSRVAKLASDSVFEFPPTKPLPDAEMKSEIVRGNFDFDKTIGRIWENVKNLDTFINEKKVWEIKAISDRSAALEHLVSQVRQIAANLSPFLPETSEKIQEIFKGPKIKPTEPLFPRLK